jgi:hypothetical protein
MMGYNGGREIKKQFKIFELTDDGTFIIPRYNDRKIFYFNEYDSEYDAECAIDRALRDELISFGTTTFVVLPYYTVVWA